MMKKKRILPVFLALSVVLSLFGAVSPAQAFTPTDYANKVGVTTTSSRYAFDSSKNVLTEGTDKIAELGTKAVKLWLGTGYKLDYYLNSSWPNVNSLVDLADTAYYQDAFSKFNVIALEAYEVGDYGDWHYGFNASQVASVKQEFYLLTKYLLQKYANTGKTFILQNWEADNQMHYGGPGYTSDGVQGIINWANARQDGIIQARNEVGENGVRVMGAFEINRVSVSIGDPRLLDTVVPYTHADLYSYSNYEVFFDSAQLISNLNDIAAKAPNDTRYGFGDKNIMLGEFGRAENFTGEADVTRTAQINVDTALDWGVQYMFFWQLYCNEDKVGLTYIKDEMEDYSKMYSHSSNWTFDSSLPRPYFEGKTTRIKRTSNTAENIVYHTTGGITHFGVNVYYTGSSLQNKVSVYLSPDNVNWTLASTTISNPVNTDGIGVWYKANVGSTDILPDGYRYLKVVVANDPDVYSPQIDMVFIGQRPYRAFTNADLNGYWLRRPDGTYSGSWYYLYGLFHPNLVRNGGFEADAAVTATPQYWSTWTPSNDADASYADSSWGSHSGTYHLTHWKNSANYNVFTYQTVTGLANGTYTATAWVKSSGGQSDVLFVAKDYDSASSISVKHIPALSEWTLVTIDNIAVTNGQATIGLNSIGGGGSYWAYMDDVKLFKKQ